MILVGDNKIWRVYYKYYVDLLWRQALHLMNLMLILQGKVMSLSLYEGWILKVENRALDESMPKKINFICAWNN